MPAPDVRGSTHTRALRSPLTAAGLALCCGLFWSACGSKDQAAGSQRPVPAPGIAPQRPAPTPAAVPPAGSSPQSYTATNNTYAANSGARYEAPPEHPAEQAAAPAEQAAKTRDYNAELSGLLSQSAAGCLAGWTPSGNASSVSIGVTAYVMESGSITRAEAQGAGLTPSVLGCIQRLASGLRMRGPVADAPRSVHAQVTLNTKATQAPQPKAAAPEHEDERDENPRDSKLQEVANDPPEAPQKDEPVPEMPAEPDARDLPPRDDNHAE